MNLLVAGPLSPEHKAGFAMAGGHGYIIYLAGLSGYVENITNHKITTEIIFPTSNGMNTTVNVRLEKKIKAEAGRPCRARIGYVHGG